MQSPLRGIFLVSVAWLVLIMNAGNASATAFVSSLGSLEFDFNTTDLRIGPNRLDPESSSALSSASIFDPLTGSVNLFDDEKRSTEIDFLSTDVEFIDVPRNTVAKAQTGATSLSVELAVGAEDPFAPFPNGGTSMANQQISFTALEDGILTVLAAFSLQQALFVDSPKGDAFSNLGVTMVLANVSIDDFSTDSVVRSAAVDQRQRDALVFSGGNMMVSLEFEKDQIGSLFMSIGGGVAATVPAPSTFLLVIVGAVVGMFNFAFRKGRV